MARCGVGVLLVTVTLPPVGLTVTGILTTPAAQKGALGHRSALLAPALGSTAGLAQCGSGGPFTPICRVFRAIVSGPKSGRTCRRVGAISYMWSRVIACSKRSTPTRLNGLADRPPYAAAQTPGAATVARGPAISLTGPTATYSGPLRGHRTPGDIHRPDEAHLGETQSRPRNRLQPQVAASLAPI